MHLMQSLGIYIQVPFCASKCSFCNFSSGVVRPPVFDGYCRAVIREIDLLEAFDATRGIGLRVFGLPVDTIYVGGGTPSLLGAERLGQIFGALKRRFEMAPRSESTLEVTPGSADIHFLQSARELGINRLSIGAQSFVDRELRVIGRLHSATDTRDLVRCARRAGFANINLDLIAGLPYQTRDSWLASLGQALALSPEHVSVYLFEIDDKSRLGGEVLRHGTRYHAAAVPDEEFMAGAYETARELLEREGYAQYEISNFALPGHESRHNQKYWRLEPYLGLGAGAHSFDGSRRWSNETAVQVYETKLGRGESPVTETWVLSPAQQLEEFFFLGLRQRKGVDLRLAANRWGADQVSRHEARIEALARDGWLERAAGRVRLSHRALLVSNEIFQEFLA
jgi:putative oxygen-independent coproporphyrinogen III oxidase